MKILVLNSGSSSIKFQVIVMPEERLICNGLVERIGMEHAVLNYKTDHVDLKEEKPILNHKQGLELVVELLLNPQNGVIKATNEIDAVGHRVVHGGSSFSETALIDQVVKTEIKNVFALAPLHNPHNLEGIHIAEQLFPTARQVAVFDTAFHNSIPEKAHRYAIPEPLYQQEKIRLYGFHGTSHKYVSEKAQAYLSLEHSNIITIHLGNGCSMTAIQDGKSIDHSLGFAPSNGLIMGSRSGDIDHAIIFYLINTLEYPVEKVNQMLTKDSGMLGLTGFADLRDIQHKAAQGNKDCQLALDMNAYRIKKYIGAYAAAMNGLDAIVFTAGIGENSNILRELVCRDMDYLGIELDPGKNNQNSSQIRELNTEHSRVKILVIPTNEELEIAKQCYDLLN